jgi:hypothetical protein
MQLAWLATAALLVNAEPEKAGPATWGGEMNATRTGDTASLVSHIRVPSACFEAAGTEAGPPAGFRVPDDTLALRLLMRSNPARSCRDSPAIVVHRLEDLDVRRKRAIFVWVVADGKIVATWHRVWSKK